MSNMLMARMLTRNQRGGTYGRARPLEHDRRAGRRGRGHDDASGVLTAAGRVAGSHGGLRPPVERRQTRALGAGQREKAGLVRLGRERLARSAHERVR